MSENIKEKKIWSKESIGYLYKKKSANGINYLSGAITIVDELGVENRYKIDVFPNRFKTSDNHPDLKIYSSKDVPPKKPREQEFQDAAKTEDDTLI